MTSCSRGVGCSSGGGGGGINKRIEMARHHVNQMVFAFLRDRRMPTIHHPAIKQCVPGQCHREGMHLTDEGNHLFLESLRAGLSSVLFLIFVF
uniref:SJCHGC09820 protein n=1 Tax=Schistosoma japonicum TaxID=6182 RepID=Q5BQT1_SCHJA|nr:SJCHGC09820 protein [Schistosoma japonicum]